MKITDMNISLARREIPPRRIFGGMERIHVDVVVIRVMTDEDIEGQSMVYCGSSGLPVAHFFADVMRPFLVGRDPTYIEAIWQDMLMIDRFHAFMQINYAGPVDVALWDIAGKRAGMPLWQLLGGYRDRIPCYVSRPFYDSIDQYVQSAKSVAEGGFCGFKLHPPRNTAQEVDACIAVREAVGDAIAL